MSYFKDIETWLDDLLPTEQDIHTMREEIKKKLLESYRNGQAAGREPAPQEERRPRRGR